MGCGDPDFLGFSRAESCVDRLLVFHPSLSLCAARVYRAIDSAERSRPCGANGDRGLPGGGGGGAVSDCHGAPHLPVPGTGDSTRALTNPRPRKETDVVGGRIATWVDLSRARALALPTERVSATDELCLVVCRLRCEAGFRGESRPSSVRWCRSESRMGVLLVWCFILFF